MSEITVKYKSKRALEALKDLSKYFDFSIVMPGVREKNKNPKTSKLNGITIVPGDSSIDTSDLTNVFSGRNIDPQKLRKEAWQRRK